jgi:cytochrome c553
LHTVRQPNSQLLCAAVLLWLAMAAAIAQSPAPTSVPAAKPATPATKPAPKKPVPKPVPEKPPAELKIAYPDWLFPIDEEQVKAWKIAQKAAADKAVAKPPPKEPPKPPTKPPAKLLDRKTGKPIEEPPKPPEELFSVPDSDQKFPLSRINDTFNAPDWHPADHGPMPEIVAQGRKPKVIACAYCHTPTGQGRPENSALAGLPESYIKEQLEAFRSGERQPVGPDYYKPTHAMYALAGELSDEDIDASARYFGQQKLGKRVYVVESLNIPRAEAADWVYKEVSGSEELGDRMLEVAPDITRHQHRDDRMQYTAYAPPGSLFRGKQLVSSGGKGTTQPCATCHGPKLQGTDKIPPIAGRSPTYLLRQLIAFRNGLRTNEAAKQMDAVVEKLELTDMVALAAYLGSLYPQ